MDRQWEGRDAYPANRIRRGGVVILVALRPSSSALLFGVRGRELPGAAHVYTS